VQPCGWLHGNVFYRCASARLGFGGLQIHGGKGFGGFAQFRRAGRATLGLHPAGTLY